MDATVEQIDGYRFIYLLPTGEHEIFVEDTYYSDAPEQDVTTISGRIAAYAAALAPVAEESSSPLIRHHRSTRKPAMERPRLATAVHPAVIA